MLFLLKLTFVPDPSLKLFLNRKPITFIPPFYLSIILSLRRLPGLKERIMNYKEKIIELLDKITDENALRFLYKIVKAFARQPEE